MKEGSPGRAGVGDRSLVVRGLLPKAQVATGVGMGVAVALAAVWAQYMVTVLLAPGGTSSLPEVVWWAVLLGIVVACGLATPVAVRLWKSGMEGLRELGATDRGRALRDRVSAPRANVAVVNPEEKDAERQLLEAIDRHGEITPARAALETTLTVAEADRMLSELAKGGHLQVRVEGGNLLYGL
jgi:hypothetical protein